MEGALGHSGGGQCMGSTMAHEVTACPLGQTHSSGYLAHWHLQTGGTNAVGVNILQQLNITLLSLYST